MKDLLQAPVATVMSARLGMILLASGGRCLQPVHSGCTHRPSPGCLTSPGLPPRSCGPAVDGLSYILPVFTSVFYACTVCGKKNREKTFARSFFKVFWPCGRPHAQNKKSGTSRSLCCQIFSLVRRLELKKTKKNENCGNGQNICKNR